MKKLLLWGALALSLAANATVAVMALRARSMPDGMLPLMLKVHLDAEQHQAVLRLREAFERDRRENQRQASQLRSRLAQMLRADAPDRAQIDAVLTGMTELQIELQRRVVEQALSVRAVLRADQRPAFEQLMTQHLVSGKPLQPSAFDPESP